MGNHILLLKIRMWVSGDEILTLYKVCAVHWGLCSSLASVLCIGGYHQYIGDIISALEISSVHWGISSVYWGISWFVWGISSVHWGISWFVWGYCHCIGQIYCHCIRGVSWLAWEISSMHWECSTTLMVYPQYTDDIPQCNEHPESWYPQCTDDTPPLHCTTPNALHAPYSPTLYSVILPYLDFKEGSSTFRFPS